MKKLVLILLVLFLSGCNVKYDLIITDKEEIKENFKVYINNEEILENYNTIDEYLDYYSNLYSESPRNKNYTIKTKESKPSSYFIVNNSYKNLDEYISSTTFLTFFNNATIERIGNYTTFTTSTNEYLQSIKNDTLLSQSDANHSFEIRVKFYNEVIDSNADYLEKDNTYVWKVNKDTTKENIYFKIGPKVKYDIVIKDYIMEHIVAIIAILSTITIALIAGIFIVVKSKKNNEV